MDDSGNMGVCVRATICTVWILRAADSSRDQGWPTSDVGITQAAVRARACTLRLHFTTNKSIPPLDDSSYFHLLTWTSYWQELRGIDGR